MEPLPENKAYSQEVKTLEYPKIVEDISSWPYMKKKDKELYCIGSKTVDRYLMIDKAKVEIIMEAIQYMDGQHSLEWIEDYLKTEKKVDLDMSLLKTKLSKAGLVVGEKASNVSSEISVMGVDLINFKFPPVKPLFRKIVSFMWNGIFGVSIIIFLMALLGVIFNKDKSTDFFTNVFIYKDSYLLGAFIATLISIINIVLHETSHWSTAIRLGLQPSEFHMSLYAGVMPMWYVKIGGIYTVSVKKRIYIMGAGMYANAILLSLSIASAMWMDLSIFQMQIMSKVMISNMFQIIYCLSPLKLTDGYYIMSQVFKVSNLRIRLLQAVGEFFNGERNKFDGSLLTYFIVSLAFLAFGTYTTLNWNFKVFFELSYKTDNAILKYIIICLPFIVLALTLFIFIRQFVKFIKKLKLERDK